MRCGVRTLAGGLLLTTLIAGTSTATAQAQGAALLAPVEQPAPSSLDPNLVVPAAPDTYVVGDEDILTVLVSRMPDLTGQFEVDSAGDISIPLIARPVHVAGATPPQIALQIERQLQQARVASRPMVRVVVREVASHLVVISGAVNHPVALQAVRPLTLAEAIARAGGLSDRAGNQVRILSKSETGGSPQVAELPLDPIVKGTQSGPLLTGGESVQVEPEQFVYVVGAVNKAGAFPVAAGQQMTLLRAIAMAQGLRSPADKSHVRVMYPGGGTPEFVVNLSNMLGRGEEDTPLRAGAVVYVPESTRSKVLNAVVSTAVQTLVLSVGYNAAHIF